MTLLNDLEELARSNPEIGQEIRSIVERHEARQGRPKKVGATQDVEPRATAATVWVPGSYALKPLPDDFRRIDPGSNDWIRFWKKFPEKQEEMLRWKRG